MKKLQLFESYVQVLNEGKKEKKDKKWLKKAIKNPGKLHKDLDVPKDETIPMDKIKSKIEELQKKADAGLDKDESKLLRRLNLAKTMKKFKKPKKEKKEEDKKD